MRETPKTPSQNIMTTDKQEIEARVEKKKFVDEYADARKKVSEQGYDALTGYERIVLEKGDDYLLG